MINGFTHCRRRPAVDCRSFDASRKISLFVKTILDKMFSTKMSEPSDRDPASQSQNRGEYRISSGPVVRFTRNDPKSPSDLPEIELPRLHRAPLLFAIARD